MPLIIRLVLVPESGPIEPVNMAVMLPLSSLLGCLVWEARMRGENPHLLMPGFSPATVRSLVSLLYSCSCPQMTGTTLEDILGLARDLGIDLPMDRLEVCNIKNESVMSNRDCSVLHSYSVVCAPSSNLDCGEPEIQRKNDSPSLLSDYKTAKTRAMAYKDSLDLHISPSSLPSSAGKPTAIGLPSLSPTNQLSPAGQFASPSYQSVWQAPLLPSIPKFSCICSHIDSGCKLFVHLLENDMKLIMSLLKIKYSGSSPLPNDLSWAPGQDCIAMYSWTEEWCRGHVMKVDLENDRCLVRFVDFGNNEYCLIKNMRKDLFAKALAIQCFSIKTEKIRPKDERMEKIREFLSEALIDQEIFVEVIPGSIPLTAVKVTSKTGEDIGVKMYSLGISRRRRLLDNWC